ncbi:MAG: hypothetical protein H7X99_08365 [Saprospiraceae bacterium]|nr:hypothetical protein [Saprospiraceae bacterium]
MIEEHIDKHKLRNKIRLLFDYRLFSELSALDIHESVESKNEFTEYLIELQTAIYHLDAHLEANWILNTQTMDWHWQNIITQLSFFDISPERANEYLNHIRKYEKHERELRQGKTPLRFDMEYFYFYKSCDVKLLRRLIYEKYQLSGLAGKLADWRYYDLVTEVNDDIEDIFEDLNFINGNRFLISLLKCGKIETRRVFSEFLNEICQRTKERFNSGKGSFQKMLLDITMRRYTETIGLLEIQLDKITENDLKTSRLMIFKEAIVI